MGSKPQRSQGDEKKLSWFINSLICSRKFTVYSRKHNFAVEFSCVLRKICTETHEIVINARMSSWRNLANNICDCELTAWDYNVNCNFCDSENNQFSIEIYKKYCRCIRL